MHRLLPLLLLALLACRTDGKEDSASTDTGQVDADGDGHLHADDCDDHDATVHPGAEEACNDIDDDCDGEIDEDLVVTWFADADGDGFGDGANTLRSCDPGSGWTLDDTDCDDDNDAVNPEADEVCNEIDDDCDGLVDIDDEDLIDAGTWYLDADSDGYGDDETDIKACEQPSDHVAEGGDCDDGDPAFHPGADESDCTDPNDYNCDGSVGYADADADGHPACEDCDDGDASVNPDADEICDELDNDCDELVDDEDPGIVGASTWYADADADGYGGAAYPTEACEQPSGHVADATDCNDGDADSFPGADEWCDGVDNDCDGDIDEGDALDQSSWCADADADGHGDPASGTDACEQPTGHVSSATDCDDTDATINPNATEICDGVDNDCDGSVDEDDAPDATTWYADTDEDGYGDATSTTTACDPPGGYVADDSDCDDDDATLNPGATEQCDSVDNDCDGEVDEDDAADASTWYADDDSDGYGDASSTTKACTQPSEYVSDATDCDDNDDDINPGATEICNGEDDDCDGTVDGDGAADASTWYADGDGDGYGDASSSDIDCDEISGHVEDATDCDDADADVNPGATELCNGVDDDCDGSVDEDDAADATTWYADADGDAYGDASSSTVDCDEISGYVEDATDCDDGDATLNPGASEDCDGVDNDCDGLVDDEDPDLGTITTWHADADLDGYGDASSSTTACEEPSGYVSDATDCDDADADVNPGASEDCDGADNDCDGDVDEDVYGDGAACAGYDCADILDVMGAATDGVYWIEPNGTAFEAYCDMTGDGGGWTLLLSAEGSSDYWGNNSAYWEDAGYDTTIPTSLADADYHAQAYGELVTEEIRLCYVDSGACYVFEHGMSISLLSFFTDDETWTEYSYDSTDIADAGDSTSVSDYTTALGITAKSVSCRWLGINNLPAISAIGLMGDGNCGCQSYHDSSCGSSGYPYHDDLAIGVGLQSCLDNNSCYNGGSGHAAGQTRGADGTDDSGVYGPWHVLGR